MVTHARSVVLLSAALAAAMVVAAAASRPGQSGLTVHEWGTFTSVAGPDGQSVNWTPLSGPQDLPCFVERQRVDTPQGLTSIQVKGRDIYGLLRLLPGPKSPAALPALPPAVPPALMVAKVRMETPVLYFYAPERVTVGIKVSFNQGVMSEWYPKATVSALNLSGPLTTTVGTIEWPAVNVVPHANATYPRDAVKSHYYAAREVDASPLEVGTQRETFLFYRGLADFQPPVTATVGPHGDVVVVTPTGLPRLVLFENRHGRAAYRIAHETAARVTLSRPVAGTVQALRSDLEQMLTAEGLYSREAKAMVETWSDSWFDEGTRIFYIIPKSTIDERLPLTITPAPASIARVFVGRLELITAEMKDEVERAILANDLDTLNAYGRFLDSIALQIADRPSLSANPARVSSALTAVGLSHVQSAVCK